MPLMPFLGKWSMVQGAQSLVVDPGSGVLSATATPTAPYANFNAYGTNAFFRLQGMNGKYIAWNGSAYVASLARDGQVGIFALEDAGSGNWRVVDLGIGGGGQTQYYWSVVGAKLGQIAKSGSPPASTIFTQTVVTVGLDSFPKFSTPTPDLTWVDLTNADLSNMTISQGDFSNGVLDGAKVDGASFPTSTFISASMKGITGNRAGFPTAVMNGADLTGANLPSATLTNVKLPNAILTDAKLPGAMLIQATLTPLVKAQRVDLSGFGTMVQNVDFTGADLSGATFFGAQLTSCHFDGAKLIGANLGNAQGQYYNIMQTNTVDAKTNCTSAQMQYLDFTGFNLQNMIFAHADLTGCKLDKTTLNGADLSYAIMTDVTMTGGVPLFGANLANATLTGVNMTGAQLGSLGRLFSVPDSSADYAILLDGLNNNNVAEVVKVFADNKYTLPTTAIITANPNAPGRVWSIQAAPVVYSVRKEPSGGGNALNVYQPTTAAVLSNAFMMNATLSGANLYNVRATGVQLYGTAKLDGYANLEGAVFDNGNLSGLNLKQAILYGVNFDYALLIGALFNGADLTPSGAGAQTSFTGASLQGADFSDAKLANVIFTDAAVAVAKSQSETALGVWLFSVAATAAPSVAAQLNAAALTTNNFTMPVQAAKFLQPGPVSSNIITFFGTKGVKLDASAITTVVGFGPYWLVTDGQSNWCLTQNCNKSTAQPALGVSSGTDPTTSPTKFLPLSLESSLTNGQVSPAVVAAFQAIGIAISASSQVTIHQQYTDWQIVDTASVWSLWLGLTGSCQLQVFVRPSMPSVMQSFINYSTPLSQRALVSGTAGGPWAVNNDSDDPFNPIVNYIKFNVVVNARQGLDVYGSTMRIQRLAAQGQAEYYNINVDFTKLKQTDLVPSTICPNSMTTASNITDELPFDQWMRARFPPRAPFCIPSADGYYYCPN